MDPLDQVPAGATGAFQGQVVHVVPGAVSLARDSYLPAGHFVHAVLPVVVVMVPRGHTAHVALPFAAENLPAAHAVQLVSGRDTGDDVPARQGVPTPQPDMDREPNAVSERVQTRDAWLVLELDAAGPPADR